jgi:dTMP kinase
VAALYARDRQTTKEKIQGWLDEGKIVIADRFVASAMAYESAFFADPKERAVFRAWVEDLEFVRMALPRPDLTMIMSVPADLRDMLVAKKEARAYTAGQDKDMHERDRAYQERVEVAYRELADQFPNTTLINCVTASGEMPSIEACHDLVWPHVEHALDSAHATL